MKIVFTYEYPFRSLGYGGGHQVIRGLARELAAMGHEVHVCCTGQDELGVVTADAPVAYHFFRHSGKVTGTLHFSIHVFAYLSKLSPDWVICQTSEAPYLSWLCKPTKMRTAAYVLAPHLVDFRRLEVETLRRMRRHPGPFMLYASSLVADRVLANSDFTSRCIHQNWGVPLARISNVGNGIDQAYYALDEQPPVPSTDRELRFITVSRVSLAEKPLDAVAEALARLPNAKWQWTIIGTGPDKAALEGRARALGIADRTRFLDFQSPAQISEILAHQDIAILPSKYESFFMTAYEAAAKSKVIVTNDVADLRAYFASSPSVVFAKTASAEGYQEALLFAIENLERLKAGAREGADRVKRDFSWNAVARRFLQALA